MTQTVTDMRSSFNGGELSLRMEGRTDTSIYRIGAATIENMLISVEGPLTKAPGFEYIRPAATDASWLSRFVFSRTQSYVLEWSNERLRFYTNGGRIESGPTTPYEVIVPYGAGEASEISRQQSFDRQYLAHRSYPPAALTRTAASTFAYAALALKNGPFESRNSDEAITVTASAVTGSVTLTASSAIFAAGDVGGLFRIEAQDFSDVTAWEPGINTISAGNVRRSEGKVYEAESGGRTGTAQPVHTEGSEWDGDTVGVDINGKGPYGIKWKYLYDRFGLLEITGYTSPTQVTATVLRRLPSSLTTVPSYRWSFGAFSPRRGWPNVVLIHDQRLVLIKDFDVFAGVVGDYGNFQEFTSSGVTAADLAYRYRLSAPDPILWAISDGGRMVLGTQTAIYPLGPLDNGRAAAAGNVGIGRPTFYGSEPIAPLQIGNLTQFVERGGRKIREGQYDFARDAIVAQNVNVWARHITRGGVVQLTHQSADEEVIFVVRGDGQLGCRSYAPEQDVKGWSRRIHGGGDFISAIAIPSEDGDQDELWALVDVAGIRSVERMATYWDESEDAAPDAFFVDSGATMTYGSPTTTVTGATWLAGKAVAVLADGAVVPGITVNGAGAFTLPVAASKVTVGLGYTAKLTSLRVEADTRSGTAQGKLKKLVNAIMRLVTTGAGLRAGTPGGSLYDIIRRKPEDPMDAPVPLFTGDTDNVRIGDGFDRDGRFTLEHSDPTPFLLTAVMPRFEVSEQ